MKTLPNQTVSLRSYEMDTLGIVADLHDEGGRDLAQETIRQTGDLELRNLVSMAQALEKRYLIAAGRFNDTGIIGAVCDDNEGLIAAYQMANARLKKTGSLTTAWMIKPEEYAALLEKVSLQSSHKGGEQ